MNPQRPVGVLLSALILGLASLFLVLFAIGSLFTALSGQTIAAAGSAQSAAITTAGMLILAFAYCVLAGWSIATLVGLLRMQFWARISTMVIAGGIVLLGLVSAVGFTAAQSLVASGQVPVPPSVPPALLHRIVVFMAAVSLLLAAAGIGWIIYLASRRTREAFTHSSRVQPELSWPAQPGYAPWPTQQTPQANPLTDFTVARPLAPPAAEPTAPPLADWQAYGAPPEHVQPAPWPVIPIPPHTRIQTGRPASVTVLAVFALISAVFSLFGLVSPFPAFLFGYMVSGWPVHLYSLVWATAAAIAGLGMLRLQRPAWILSFVLLGVSAINALTTLLPSGRARYAAYIVSTQQNSPFGHPGSPIAANLMAASIAIGMVFGLVLMAFCAVLLWRARWAFEPTSLPSVDPPQNESHP